MIDIVITYVNYEDPIWYKNYCDYIGSSLIDKERFRDIGTLKYLLRSIEKNLNWIRKIHLVVSNESQVPDWINRDIVNIVYHKDIIPLEFLPVFNSCAIEMFIPFIQGLSEKYIYFNDDMFVLKPLSEDYWFKDDKICTDFHLLVNKSGVYYNNIINSSRLVFNEDIPINFNHSLLGFITEDDKIFYEKNKESINKSITKLRDNINMNQYMYQYNYINNNKVILRDSDSIMKRLTLNNINIDSICNIILNPISSILCINDDFPQIAKKELINDKIQKILNAFSKKFPQISKYEKL